MRIRPPAASAAALTVAPARVSDGALRAMSPPWPPATPWALRFPDNQAELPAVRRNCPPCSPPSAFIRADAVCITVPCAATSIEPPCWLPLASVLPLSTRFCVAMRMLPPFWPLASSVPVCTIARSAASAICPAAVASWLRARMLPDCRMMALCPSPPLAVSVTLPPPLALMPPLCSMRSDAARRMVPPWLTRAEASS